MPDTIYRGDQQPVLYDTNRIDTTYLNVPDGYMLYDVVPGNDTGAGHSDSGWYALTPEQPWATVYIVLTPANSSDPADTDGDGLPNDDEWVVYGTNPNAIDTDFGGALGNQRSTSAPTRSTPRVGPLSRQAQRRASIATAMALRTSSGPPTAPTRTIPTITSGRPRPKAPRRR